MDDLISRQAAINWIINLSADIGKIQHQDLWHYEQALDEIRALLEQTADKKGRWAYDEERGATGIYAICTACNEMIYQTGEFNYCPHCGARMEESE